MNTARPVFRLKNAVFSQRMQNSPVKTGLLHKNSTIQYSKFESVGFAGRIRVGTDVARTVTEVHGVDEVAATSTSHVSDKSVDLV